MGRVQEAWDETYSKNEAYMHYPREPVVVLYHRFKNLLPHEFTCLDYGFGSGNHSEFIIDKAKELYGIEISQSAIALNQKRLSKYENFDPDNLKLSDNSYIEEFKDKFDCIIAWNCLMYNDHNTLKKTIEYLHKYLKKDGIIILSMPTQRSGFRKFSSPLSFNTYIIGEKISEQEGCIISIPKDTHDFLEYFSSFKLLDYGHEEMYSYMGNELQSHYYGVFQKI